MVGRLLMYNCVIIKPPQAMPKTVPQLIKVQPDTWDVLTVLITSSPFSHFHQNLGSGWKIHKQYQHLTLLVSEVRISTHADGGPQHPVRKHEE